MSLPLEISAPEVKRRLDLGEKLHLIDVREPQEHAIARIEGADLVPMRSVPGELQTLEARADIAPLIVFCHHGVRSLNVVHWLREQGLDECQSMTGGIEDWSLTGGPLRFLDTKMREKAPLYLAGAAAVTAVASIVGSEVFLGAALVAALASGRKWRWPPPSPCPSVALWMIWTLLSLAVSGHARGGFPQVKKLIWFAMLFVVFQSVRRISEIRGIVLGWAVAAALSAAWGMEQFVRKYHAAKLLNREFYNYYLPSRITGFMAHWMTLSGHMMIALMLLIGALLLLSRQPCGPQNGVALASRLVTSVGLACSAPTFAVCGAAPRPELFICYGSAIAGWWPPFPCSPPWCCS